MDSIAGFPPKARGNDSLQQLLQIRGGLQINNPEATKKSAACKIIMIIAILLALPTPLFANMGRFVDPVRGISFSVPQSWDVTESFGGTIAVLKDSNGAEIKVEWMAGKDGAPARDTLMDAMAREFSGAKINAAEELDVKGTPAIVAGFEAAHSAERGNLSGQAALLAAEDGFLITLCSAPKEKYYDSYFTCREFLTGIDVANTEFARGGGVMPKIFDMPSPEIIRKARAQLSSPGASLDDVAKLSAERSLFALLDGRAGCPGVADEPARLAKIAGKSQMTHWSEFFNKLAAMLKREIPFPPSDFLNDTGGEYFAKLAAARDDLEKGNANSALRHLEGSDDMSQLAAALKVWAAGMKGDVRTQKRIEAEIGPFCGESGSLALYHLGLSEKDSRLAARKFDLAIDADPSFVPAYTALARAMLGSGEGADAVKTRISELLAIAPDAPQMERLKMAFGDFRMRDEINGADARRPEETRPSRTSRTSQGAADEGNAADAPFISSRPLKPVEIARVK